MKPPFTISAEQLAGIFNCLDDIFLVTSEWEIESGNSGEAHESLHQKSFWEHIPSVLIPGLKRAFRNIFTDLRQVHLTVHDKVSGKAYQVKALPLSPDFTVIQIRELPEKREETESRLLNSRKELGALASYIQSAREEERKNLAREVHDELGQLLTALKIDLTLLDKTIRKETNIASDLIAKEVSGMKAVVDESLRTVKKIIGNLRPVDIEKLGLLSEIEAYARGYLARTGIKVKFSFNEIKMLPFHGEKALEIFRIIQEALTNAVRHANASEVELALKKVKSRYHFEIRDNGKGFRADSRKSSSFGILGMKERAALIGASFNLQSSEKGTSVQLLV